MRLYEISESYKNLIELLDNDDVDKEVLNNSLNSVADEFNNKVENICKLRSNIIYDAEIISKEIDRLKNKEKSLLNKADNLKNYIENCMLITNIKKVKTPLFNCNIQKNTPAVIITDDTKIDEKYIKVKEVVSIDKKLILQDIKNNIDVVGAKVVQNESIRIK